MTLWEYVSVEAEVQSTNNFGTNVIEVPQEQLDYLGSQGWELVDIVPYIETVHPNFGNDKYVTGLQANTRTAKVVYLFKRPVSEERAKNETPGSEIE